MADEAMAVPKILTAAQKARSERNRQKALLLRQSRVANKAIDAVFAQTNIVKSRRVADTGGGFMLDSDEEPDDPGLSPTKKRVVEQAPPLLVEDRLFCDECQKEFQHAYLYINFAEPVCDNCKENSDQYALITRTKAKQDFLLKDADLDKREPRLKFIVKRNPHNHRWGDMKLYIYKHIHTRAMEVWGSEEELDTQRSLMESNRDKIKQKKFDKKIKELRNSVRSSIWKKDLGNHEHVYGDEMYSPEDDVYTKVCTGCGHSLSYEKM